MSASNNTTAALRFSGVYTALVTPFTGEGEDAGVAYDDLRRLIDFQIERGIAGISVVGTTGESPTLTPSEHLEVIAKTVEYVNGRVPVLAGTGSNSTQEALHFTREADKVGADAFLIVAPYYNKPTPNGIYEHFHQLAEATAKPIVLYSVPKRCGVEIAVETVRRLRAKHRNIAAIKEASDSCARVSQFVRELDSDFAVLSGEDALTLPFLSLGASGVVSVASNWLPAEMSALVNRFVAGDIAGALAEHKHLAEVFANIFIEVNPVPIKHVLARKKLITSSAVRLPLVSLEEKNAKLLDALVDNFR
ncbi:MAG: 4-hydroxy-tetrahydrodipicolinate synthase [Puniceicoccales bacterium]|jgi:4-hydroxy-tetrahydrodipicolinate synthase|nr:4-hydroxy-tetrahydrodipicolinate synthase [Puniceicoccales bacterium]